VIGLDLSEASVDGSQHKAPTGGEGSGRNPANQGKVGWKCSLITDRWGIPIGWAIDGANRHDTILFAPTLAVAKARGLLMDVKTLHLDRGYNSAAIRAHCADHGIEDVVCASQRCELQRAGMKTPKLPVPLGLRWPIERTNSWLSNFGQLRRGTDRKTAHRLAQLALAITFLLAAKLIDWRDRWSPIR